MKCPLCEWDEDDRWQFTSHLCWYHKDAGFHVDRFDNGIMQCVCSGWWNRGLVNIHWEEHGGLQAHILEVLLHGTALQAHLRDQVRTGCTPEEVAQ